MIGRGAYLSTAANMQDPHERIEHLRNASKFFSEHKDRAFEAKVSSKCARV